MKLVSIHRANDGKHKYIASFESPKRTTRFGAAGYEDYTQHHDPERRKLYRNRHKKDLLTGDPAKAGYLSYYLLWGDSTSLQENIATYKKRFNL
jgi:hypothetical protein